MAASSEPDWEKARNWLKNEKVTRNSAKVRRAPDFQPSLMLSPQVPDLANIKTEAELYTYLKDGTELCRMIGIVTKGTVLERITYR